MTRFPAEGAVKTRLEPVVRAEGALRIHSELARHCVRRMHAVMLSGLVDLNIYSTGESAARVQRWLGRRVKVRAQSGSDLGDRLGHAARMAFKEGTPAVILIGSDAPDLGGSHVRMTLALLVDCDVVLGPATDGGYYLVGMNREAADQAIPALFGHHVPWGSDRVLAITLDAARSAGLQVRLLDTLSDVDRPEDLAIWERVRHENVRRGQEVRLSVVIPTLNEEAEIEGAVRSAREAGAAEVIVADAGSTDHTANLARLSGARVIRALRGRARQLNAGAAPASGDVLLFLHADSRLPADALDHIGAAMSVPGCALGCFAFEAGDPGRRTDRLITTAGRLLQRISRIPFGDQALFIRRQDFVDLGGFLEIPVMEDYEFARRCRRFGRLTIVDADCTTSARAWHNHGLIRVTLIDALVITGYLLGVSIDRLAAWRSRILAPTPPARGSAATRGTWPSGPPC
jgi:uncharacterized protein